MQDSTIVPFIKGDMLLVDPDPLSDTHSIFQSADDSGSQFYPPQVRARRFTLGGSVAVPSQYPPEKHHSDRGYSLALGMINTMRLCSTCSVYSDVVDHTLSLLFH